jgi:hypothetical protein
VPRLGGGDRLLVVAALGLCVLAARGWDAVLAGSLKGIRTKTFLLIVVAVRRK